MANLYGVANPIIYPAYATVIGGVDLACPAGTETNVIDSGALVAISNGYYYPVVCSYMNVTLGATPPTSLVVAARIGAGSDFSTFGPYPSLLVAGATLFITGMLVGPISQTAWQGAGSHIFVTVNPVAQGITFRSYSSGAFFYLYRAPDQ